MRTITETINLYTYNELSEEAKNKAKNWYLEGREVDFFSEVCISRLTELFPKSDLKVEFSLSYCQGDGLNIYGHINMDDLLEYIKSDLSNSEYKAMTHYISVAGSDVEMPCNRRYSYCICDSTDYVEQLESDLERLEYRNINEDALNNFNHYARVALSRLCSEFENDGYSYFYEVREEEIVDAGYEFTEDGEVY